MIREKIIRLLKKYNLYITSQLLRIYNVLQRGYKVRIIYFFRKSKSF